MGKPEPRPTPAMTPDAVRHFMDALAEANPEPRGELSYMDSFTLLIAVLLSARTTDAAVNKATATLFAEASSPPAMLALGVDGVARHIRGLGFWQTKANHVVALSRRLVEQYGGVVPRQREALEALPGVGRKTANVVLNVAFGEPTVAVDTHVFRVANRTGLAAGETPRAVEDALLARLPPERLALAHHWLILHGRHCCKARLPECWRCVAASWCRYADKSPAPTAGMKGRKRP
jgi:endonuclease-3